MKKRILILCAVAVALGLAIGIPIVSTAAERRSVIRAYEETAESLGLKDVKVEIKGKYSGFDIYDVIVYSSSFDDMSSSQLLSAGQRMDGCYLGALASAYVCNGNRYMIYPGTNSIYKNGEQIYDDYYNSESYASVQARKPQATPQPTKKPGSYTGGGSSWSYLPSNDDPYEVYDYLDPDDFYYDHFDDFVDYEEAEEYFYEYWDD